MTGLSQVLRKEVACDIEHTRAIDAFGLRPAFRVLADIHSEWSGEFIKVRAVEKCMRQTID